MRGIHGEHSESEGGVYDISNKQRLGISEFEAVKQMYDGVKYLIDLEEGKVEYNSAAASEDKAAKK